MKANEKTQNRPKLTKAETKALEQIQEGKIKFSDYDCCYRNSETKKVIRFDVMMNLLGKIKIETTGPNYGWHPVVFVGYKDEQGNVIPEPQEQHSDPEFEYAKVFPGIKEGVDYMVKKGLTGWFGTVGGNVYWCYSDGKYKREINTTHEALKDLKNVFSKKQDPQEDPWKFIMKASAHNKKDLITVTRGLDKGVDSLRADCTDGEIVVMAIDPKIEFHANVKNLLKEVGANYNPQDEPIHEGGSVTLADLKVAEKVFEELHERNTSLWFIRDSANKAMLSDTLRGLRNLIGTIER